MNSRRVTGKPEVVLKLEAVMGGKLCEKVVRGEDVGSLVFDIAYLGIGWPGGRSMHIIGNHRSVRGWLISSRVNQ